MTKYTLKLDKVDIKWHSKITWFKWLSKIKTDKVHIKTNKLHKEDKWDIKTDELDIKTGKVNLKSGQTIYKMTFLNNMIRMTLKNKNWQTSYKNDKQDIKIDEPHMKNDKLHLKNDKLDKRWHSKMIFWKD